MMWRRAISGGRIRQLSLRPNSRYLFPATRSFAQRARNERQPTYPGPPGQAPQHLQCGLGFEIGATCQHHRVGFGAIRIDAELRRQRAPLLSLDSKETKFRAGIPFDDETHPARTEDAVSIVQDYAVRREVDGL